MGETIHDIHDFVSSSQRSIQEEYERIQKRAAEDPGTAGDQGEENWATLLRDWLPPYFHIRTKGRVLAESGVASQQIDIVVLTPAYPRILLDKKVYLAGGVVAAFECKTTLKAEHAAAAVETGAKLKRGLRKQTGSPYKDLNSSIVYGLLAHSHAWKGERSTPCENIEKAVWDADSQFVQHPAESLDFLCVADLATWTVVKMNYVRPEHFDSDEMAKLYGGYALTAYMRHGIGQDRQHDYFSPLGTLFGDLFAKLAWSFHDMRGLDSYFRHTDLQGRATGRSRKWDISVYSFEVQERLRAKELSGKTAFDEWSAAAMI